jgi:hypothetical protein
LGRSDVEIAAKLLARLRSGDRLDELARDYGTSVHAIRKAFAIVGIDRRRLELLRSTRKTPVLRLPDDLARYLHRARQAQRTHETKGRTRWSDEDILGCLELASTMAFPLTATEFDNLREEHHIQGPSALTVAHRFGSWSRACEVAGVECGSAPRESYTRSWTNRELISFVGDYLSTTHRPSFTGYSQWEATTEGAPSAATVRNRLGPWTDVKHMAMQATAR